jgi:hypothetical protein
MEKINIIAFAHPPSRIYAKLLQRTLYTAKNILQIYLCMGTWKLIVTVFLIYSQCFGYPPCGNGERDGGTDESAAANDAVEIYYYI